MPIVHSNYSDFKYVLESWLWKWHRASEYGRKLWHMPGRSANAMQSATWEVLTPEDEWSPWDSRGEDFLLFFGSHPWSFRFPHCLEIQVAWSLVLSSVKLKKVQEKYYAFVRMTYAHSQISSSWTKNQIPQFPPFIKLYNMRLTGCTRRKCIWNQPGFVTGVRKNGLLSWTVMLLFEYGE